MTQTVPLEQAIQENLWSGCSVAFEGFTHLIPFAAAHELIRSGIGDLTIMRMTPDVIYDQLVGVGAARKLIFSYAGNPGVGLLRRIRDAVENDWPHKLEIEEHSHSAMANAYEAGAANLPFAVLRGYQGPGLADVNDNIRTVTCPFTGEELAAVPSLRPDVAVIHAQRADRLGNVLLEGIVGVSRHVALAACRTIVTVEEVVDDLDCHTNSRVLPAFTVDAISVVPGGAHPSYAHGYYERDNAFYIAWDAISSDRKRFLEWIDEHVHGAGPEDFRARVKNCRL